MTVKEIDEISMLTDTKEVLKRLLIERIKERDERLAWEQADTQRHTEEMQRLRHVEAMVEATERRIDLGKLLRKVAGFFVGEYDKIDKR